MPGPSDRLSQHGTMRKVAVFSSFGAHNRAKGAKSGRPPRAPQAGVAVPDGPACTSQPPCIMLWRLRRPCRKRPYNNACVFIEERRTTHAEARPTQTRRDKRMLHTKRGHHPQSSEAVHARTSTTCVTHSSDIICGRGLIINERSRHGRLCPIAFFSVSTFNLAQRVDRSGQARDARH